MKDDGCQVGVIQSKLEVLCWVESNVCVLLSVMGSIFMSLGLEISESMCEINYYNKPALHSDFSTAQR